MKLRLFCFLFLASALMGCAATPPASRPDIGSAPPPTGQSQTPASTETHRRISPTPPPFVYRTASFDQLPDWQRADLAQAIKALEQSCTHWSLEAHTAPVSRQVRYAGQIADWQPICAALDLIKDRQSARLIFEALFTPLEILPKSKETPRFTGYYEPQITARKRPEFPYTHPIPALPRDLIWVDGGQIGKKRGTRVPAQRLPNGRMRAYPPRSDIRIRPDEILGYAHPSDVFFLQIQGSGRLVFKDGQIIRAAYAAHNGHAFGSLANYLLRTGKISRGEASMQGIRAWMDRVGRKEAEAAMNTNPRFVFFKASPLGHAATGPAGAMSVPLTPLGSMAIDTGRHPLGIPFFVTTKAPGLGGQWSGVLIGQDTGGAIKGNVRGDIYYGTGEAAGQRAGTQNAPGRMWALLPNPVAIRLSRFSSPQS